MAPLPSFHEDTVADLGDGPRLAPVLRRLLRHARHLTGSPAGSVSLIDAGSGSYVKAAEYGASCRLGQSFPLDEGATGNAYARRRPVLIPDYGRLRAGHLAAGNPARRGPAAAVPIWWRGDVVAVSVAFGIVEPRRVDEFEALAQSVASVIVTPGASLRAPDAPFTAREFEVLRLLRHGLTYREIAARLLLSPKTVDKHISAILRKTATTNRTAAVVTALDNNWLRP